MRTGSIRWALSLALALCVAGLSFGEPGARPERVDLARAYMEYERALRETPLEREVALSLAGRAFDRATVQFFRGNPRAALRALNELSAKLHGGEEPLRLALNSLKLTLDPGVLIGGDEQMALIRAVGLHDLPVDLGEADLGGLRLVVRSVRGDVVGMAELMTRLESGYLMAEGVWLVRELGVGDYELFLRAKRGVERGMGMVSVLERSPDVAASDYRDRLEELGQDGELAASIRVVRAWVDVIDPSMRRYETTRFITHQAELHEEVERALSMLEGGEDPLFDRRGDHWGVIDGPSGEVPYRVYVPRNVDGRDESSLLMMVLHGAGGSEHMFFEGCDDGLIKRLADEHGFIVVSPATYPIMGDASAFDSVVETIAGWHAIDADRVLILGHSLGGITASGLAQLRSDRIAGVCGIAGTRPFAEKMACAPVLIIGAGEDDVVPAGRLREWSEDARSRGLPVEYREEVDLGHTIVVNVVLRDAVEWLLERASEVQRMR